MIDTPDPTLSWTDHFVEYGFAVKRGLVDREFCEAALGEIQELVGNGLPVSEWSTENTPLWHRPFYQGATPPQPVLDQLYDQPRLVATIEDLFGDAGPCNLECNYYLFLKPYNPAGQAVLAPRGHIDFSSPLVPALYRGFTFQLALRDTEPFSGNITFFPGTHKSVQKLLIGDPDIEIKSGTVDLPMPRPYEFVAKAGDVVFMHHLVIHSGNASHSANRLSRIGLHGEAFRDEWLRSIDPAQPGLGPWERSLAHNGAFTPDPAVEQAQMKKRTDYLEQLRSENTPVAAGM